MMRRLILLVFLLSAARAEAARYISKANGNFTDASTWAPVATCTGCVVDSQGNSNYPSSSYSYSSTFTPAADPIDAVALWFVDRNSAGSGTTTVQLYNNTTSTETFSVTVNNTDFEYVSSGNTEHPDGWYVFKAGSPFTPNGTDTYKIGIKQDAGNVVRWYNDGTTSNWSRMLRLTTSASAPAANDKLMIMGEYTAPATYSAFTVTMNNTATTSFGPTVSGGPPCGMTISKNGTLAFGTAASTNYVLKFKGTLCNWGTLTMGDPGGTGMPSTSTAELILDAVAQNDTNIGNYGLGTFKSKGVNKPAWTTMTASLGGFVMTNGTAVTALGTLGQSFVGLTGTIKINGSNYTIASITDATHLTLTGSAGVNGPWPWIHVGTSNVVTLASTTGMVAGNTLAFGPSGRSWSDGEAAVIQTVDSSTQVTLTTALNNPHLGADPIHAEVADLTRNVKIHGAANASANSGGFYVGMNATVDLEDTEIYWLASNGMWSAEDNGSLKISGGTAHDYNGGRALYNDRNPGRSRHINIDHWVFYNTYNGIWLGWDGNNGWTDINVDSVLGMRLSNGSCFEFSGRGTYTNLTCSGSNARGVVFSGDGQQYYGIHDLTVHACYGGMDLPGGTAVSRYPSAGIYNLTAYHNSTYGVWIGCGSGTDVSSTPVHDVVSFGNVSNGVDLTGCTPDPHRGANWYNWTSASSTMFSQGAGIGFYYWNYGLPSSVKLTNMTLGPTSGAYLPNTSGYIVLPQTMAPHYWYLDNVLMGSTPEVANASYIASGGIFSANHDQTPGMQRSWVAGGIIDKDTSSIGGHTQPYERLTPNSASIKLQSGKKCSVVASGGTVSFTTNVYKSASYNGNQPRLILLRNYGVGITSDTVLATAVGGTGSWLTLSGTSGTVTADTVLCAIVDVDGTAGTVDIDDTTIS